MIRLRDLDPVAVADEAHQHVLDRIHTLAFAAGVSVAPPDHAEAAARVADEVAVLLEPSGDPVVGRIRALGISGVGISDVHNAVRQLAAYARTGVPPEGRSELVPEYYISLVAPELVPDDVADADAETPWGVVVLACLARDALARPEPVPRVQLAALGSTTSDAIRKLVSRGTLRETDDRRVWANDAKRWLAGERVPGFAT